MPLQALQVNGFFQLLCGIRAKRRPTLLPSRPDALLLALTSLANGLCISWMRESIDVDKVREALHFTFDKLTGN